jgi:hypothetical protein
MAKTLNYIIFFFLHQNQNIFFSNIGNQNIFLEKNQAFAMHDSKTINTFKSQYGIFGLKRFSNWRYDWCIVVTKQQASKLPVCQHLSTDRVYHFYHGYSSRFLS